MMNEMVTLSNSWVPCGNVALAGVLFVADLLGPSNPIYGPGVRLMLVNVFCAS